MRVKKKRNKYDPDDLWQDDSSVVISRCDTSHKEKKTLRTHSMKFGEHGQEKKKDLEREKKTMILF